VDASNVTSRQHCYISHKYCYKHCYISHKYNHFYFDNGFLQYVDRGKENWFTDILFSTLKHEIDLNVEELSSYLTENMMSVLQESVIVI